SATRGPATDPPQRSIFPALLRSRTVRSADVGVRGEVMLDVVLLLAAFRFATSLGAHIENAQRSIWAFAFTLRDTVPLRFCFGECDECGLGHTECLKVDGISRLSCSAACPYLAGIHGLEFLLGTGEAFRR